MQRLQIHANYVCVSVYIYVHVRVCVCVSVAQCMPMTVHIKLLFTYNTVCSVIQFIGMR